ncbi:MAG: YgiQ family radical SAM protein [Ruminococcaceae bacterium]|nr:YgiQ family radical SAM protein [Oscillospiraceae bacterium]
MNNKNLFLPLTTEEMKQRGWNEVDFVLISADAYVDHPSFANAIIGRVVSDLGFKVGIISQPDWNNDNAFKIFGKPKYAFLISGGNIDSMVNHYTVNKKKRSTDSYSPGGKAGLRPDRPTIVYSNKIRGIYKDVPVIVGGIEASLRRFAHYDYWQDKIKRSVLCDSQADLLIYGMGERSIKEIVTRLGNGEKIESITDVKGTCYLTKDISGIENYIMLPSFNEVCESKTKYAKSVKLQYEEHNAYIGKILIEKQNDNLYLVENPPQKVLSRQELDKVYSLPYQRKWHPLYDKMGGVPAIDEVKFSVISERGCFGGCNFCSLAFHQGRVVSSRSEKSIISEVKKIVYDEDFKGYIHDVGGPTANFRFPACEKQLEKGACKNRQCLAPTPCKNLKVSHTEYLNLLRKIKEIDGVKKVFIRSGIRFDYLIYDKNNEFFKELVSDHVSGQLKVAPEHCSKNVLNLMGKPEIKVFNKFRERFFDYSKKAGKEQYIVPYLMSSHPGSSLKDAIMLAEYLRDINYQPEQVQDFYPTPGTISTCMYYTGLNPLNMEKVYVPKSYKEKNMQRALLQYRKKENYEIVKEALTIAGRKDLIGFDKKCLIKPRITNNKNDMRRKKENESTNNKRKTSLTKHQRKNKKRGK